MRCVTLRCTALCCAALRCAVQGWALPTVPPLLGRRPPPQPHPPLAPAPAPAPPPSSGHKLYGPKGIGAIYIRRRPRVRLEAQMSGGGQERGLRSGTVPHFLAVGLGAACEVAQQEMGRDQQHIKRLSDRLYHGITSQLEVRGGGRRVLGGRVPLAGGRAPRLRPALPRAAIATLLPPLPPPYLQGVVLNGDSEARYWGNVNLSFAYVEGESLLMGLKVGGWWCVVVGAAE